MKTAATTVANALSRQGLLEQGQLAEVKALVRTLPDGKEMLAELVKRGWLTSFQAERVLQGKAEQLVLDKYVLLDRLGQGGMGEVFKARHRLMDRVVALKTLPASADGDDQLERFRREIRALARLSHPNVIVAHDAGLAGDRLFLVMEYVEGIDLAEMVRRRGPLPVGEASDYARQAALALQHVHASGLVHRDVKPSNLMVAGGTVKLLDLGLARFRNRDGSASTDLTRHGTLMGSLDYLAPEQADDPQTADIRSDLYSLGCTLFFLLTGQPPFPGGSVTQKLSRHRSQEPPPLNGPAGLAAVVRKLLAKAPSQRFQSPAETAAGLAKWASPAIAANPSASAADALADPSKTTTYHPWGRRRLRFAWLAGGALALLAVLCLAVWRFWPGTPQPVKGAKAPSRWHGKPGELFRTQAHRLHLARPPDRALLIDGGSARVLDLNDLTWVRSEPFKDCDWGFLAPDGQQAVLGSGFGIRLVDVASGARLFDFDNSWVELEIGAFSSDGRRFATAGNDHNLTVWDLPGRKKHRDLRKLPGRCNSLAFCLNDRCLLCCEDEALRLWDIEHAQERNHLDRRAVIKEGLLSPDRSLFLISPASPFVEVFDLEKWTSTARFRVRGGGYQFSADNRRVLCGWVPEVSLWDVARQEKLCELPNPPDTGNITSAVLSPDGRRILTGHWTGDVWLWDVATEKPTRLAQFKSPLWSVAFLDDDRALLWCNDHAVYVWGLPP
jgi:hypothetical protein